MTFTGKTYDILKFLALVALPAFGTLYFALSGIWGLPAAEQVIGTITVVDTFLGTLLHISTQNYNGTTASGTLTVHETADKKTYGLELDGDPEYDLEGKKQVMFRVQKTKTAAARRPRAKPKE